MNCCSHGQGIATTFDRKNAERELEQYRRKGPDPVTRRLLAEVAAAGGGADSVLDIGSGVGIVAFELLMAGASRATLVEASAASLAAAVEEANRRGLAQRITPCEGDVVDLAAGLPAADVVTLNRVICCYPDMRRLVQSSANLARRHYAAVYPRESWWVKLVFAAENVVRRLQGNTFRTFVHPEREIEGGLWSAGLRPRARFRGTIWVTAVFERQEFGEVG